MYSSSTSGASLSGTGEVVSDDREEEEAIAECPVSLVMNVRRNVENDGTRRTEFVKHPLVLVPFAPTPLFASCCEIS